MSRYFASRLFSSLLTLWVIATITFFLMHAVPGSPFASEKKLPEAILQNLERKYHLDWPLWRQYLNYLGNISRFDLGPSLAYENQSVNKIIGRGFPVSAELGGLAMGLAVVLGIAFGVVAGLMQHRWQDHLSMFFATIGFSVPNFVLATVFIYLFAYKWQVLPAGRWGEPQQMIMPAVALSALPMAFIARLVRSTMVEVLQQDYIRNARAKGLPGRIVVYRHALKNALLPVLTYLGPLSAAVLTGSFVVEDIFSIPGMGRQFVVSITNRDYTVIMGVTMFYSALLVLANFLVDIGYARLDPRIKVAGEKG